MGLEFSAVNRQGLSSISTVQHYFDSPDSKGRPVQAPKTQLDSAKFISGRCGARSITQNGGRIAKFAFFKRS